MKKLIGSIVLVATVLASVVSTYGQVVVIGGSSPASVTSDSEAVARALLFFSRTKEFTGGFNAQRPDGSWSTAYFTQDRNGGIFQLNIDGVEIKIPAGKPLKGIPFVLGTSMPNFNLWLNAMDYNGRQKAYGSFYAPALTASSVIDIVLKPGQIQKFVAYVPPLNVDQNLLRLKLDDGSIYWYDSYRGGFTLWLDPVSDDQTFVIYRKDTGVEIYVGITGPHTAPVAANQKAVNSRNAGNVVDADFPYDDTTGQFADFIWFQELSFDGSIIGKAGSVPAKVLTTDLASDGGLIIYISDPDAVIKVQQWTEDGPLSVLELKTLNASPYGKSVYSVLQGLGKLVVTITSPNVGQTFFVQFGRYRGSPDGGGKGRQG